MSKTLRPVKARSRRLASTVTIAALVVGVVLTAASATAKATTTTGRTLLAKLTVQVENTSRFHRANFPHWIDAHGDGCTTRDEVLIAEPRVPVTMGRSVCAVLGGRWYSVYDGRTWTDPLDVDIDHFVSLSEAWDSGAHRWTAGQRLRFANDLGHPWTLNAMTDDLNMTKGDADPAQWLPPKSRCSYARHWVAVKYRWRLSIDPGEKQTLTRLLSGRCGALSLTVPRRAR